MKLLLTSAGITNNSIANSLEKLVGFGRAKIKIGLIPTAMNAEEGNKDWFISELNDLNKHGFNWVDVVDFSADDTPWQKRLEQVDVVFVNGGNTFHLLNQIRKHKFDSWLLKALETKVYLGVSAGSIVVAPTIKIASCEPADENVPKITDFTGLKLVNFEISPHTPEVVSYKTITKYAKLTSHPIYALDNNSAVEVVDGKIEIISEGEWKKFN